MNYTLMHGKIPVAEIEIFEETATILKIGKVFAPEHLPVGIGFVNDLPNRGNLNEWWSGRSIPASRQNFREAMENLGVSSSGKLLTKCFGLSLSDQYWVNPTEKPLKWEDINFFDNPFSEDVGNVLFGNPPQGNDINLSSPDNTSDGWLKKKWKIIDGERCLIKGGSGIELQEPLNEAMATSVMKRLNIEHVPYIVAWENEAPFSICKNFIDSQKDLVSAFNINSTQKMKNSVSAYQHFLDCCQVLGIPNAQENIDKMLVVDYLIANRDRHYNNFGAIRNAKTLEWVGVAPVFDSGTSFWNDKSSSAMLKITKTESKPFRSTHEEQIKLVKSFSWLDLSALNGIEDDFFHILSLSSHIDEKRRNSICSAFRNRVESLRKHIKDIEDIKDVEA
ncbi:MAG: HipA domain-containing protein [Oscillospiraceae bacterium]|nr:HipA domain-containing protein [Oscillospiraceae bacterium]